jgi:oxygen-independent coproporphyrinogen-3 oxidase
VQSFNDEALRRIGRIHDAAQAERAVKQAQDAGIDNLNLDLMYALPEQTMAGALDDVEKAILLQTPHLSHYQLTLEPNTAFAANPPPLPDDDSAWDMQEACQARIAAAGLTQYEVSAYARPGHECRHNLNYWHFGDYLGIGAGAHGKLSTEDVRRETKDANAEHTGSPAAKFQIRRRWKVRAPRGYLEHAGSERRIGGDDIVPDEQVPFEFMLNALRLNAGFSLTQFSATTGLDPGTIRTRLEAAVARDWLTLDGDEVRTTDFGRRFLNDVIAAFLPDTKSAALHLHGGPPHD